MTNQSSTIVQRLWKTCNVLRDDGMSYGDPLLPARAMGGPRLRGGYDIIVLRFLFDKEM
jgi:hypothetical protein